MKLKLIISTFLVFALFLLVKNTNVSSASSVTKEKFSLPSTAMETKADVYYLGKAKDVDGRDVEGYAFVHGKAGEVKPAKPSNGGPSCYGFLASGAKWKGVEPWVVNTDNSRGLSSSFVSGNLDSDVTKWESAAGKNIVGSSSTTNDILEADTVSPDDVNEVYFADVTDSNAIAVTIVWGIFGGPPQGRELVEWDQVYDDVDYDWSSAGEAGKMDFENIATHELGHTFGMDDIYNIGCSAVTMYGYAGFGETNKQTLEQPDVTGVQKLYN